MLFLVGITTHQREDGQGKVGGDDVDAIDVFIGSTVIADSLIAPSWLEDEYVDAEEDRGQQMIDHQG